jgi:hypothetical protein
MALHATPRPMLARLHLSGEDSRNKTGVDTRTRTVTVSDALTKSSVDRTPLLMTDPDEETFWPNARLIARSPLENALKLTA